MSSKRSRDRSGMIQGVQGSSKPLSEIEEFDRKIYGDILDIDAGRQIAEPVDIFLITPDPAQPRRAVPFLVRENVQAHDAPSLLEAWVKMAEVPIESLLYEEDSSKLEESDALEDSSKLEESLQSSLLEIVRLASSIRRSGLINPITLVQHGPQYRLETGERRWLAYHLLYAVTHDEKFHQIPARVVEKFDVWRQASENNARQNLNAIGRARQFALLLMDLWANDAEKPRQFEPLEAFAHEQQFYAQVGDLRAPYGKGTQLKAALNTASTSMLTRCRTLLDLPAGVWEIGDDLSLPEDVLLNLAKLPPDVAVDEARSFLNPDRAKSKPEKTADEIGLNVKKHMTWLIRHQGQLTAKQRPLAVERIGALRKWLDDLESDLAAE